MSISTFNKQLIEFYLKLGYKVALISPQGILHAQQREPEFCSLEFLPPRIWGQEPKFLIIDDVYEQEAT
jgi:hypothetical protein